MKKTLSILAAIFLTLTIHGCDNYPENANMKGVLQYESLPDDSFAIFFKMEPKDLHDLKAKLEVLLGDQLDEPYDYFLTDQFDEVMKTLPQNSDTVKALKKSLIEFRSAHKTAQENWKTEGIKAEIAKLNKKIQLKTAELNKVKANITGYESELASPNEEMEKIKAQILNLESQIDTNNKTLLKLVNQTIIDQRIPVSTFSDSTNVIKSYSYHDLSEKSSCDIQKANYFSKYDMAIKNDGKCFNILVNTSISTSLKNKVDWSIFEDQSLKIVSANKGLGDLKKKMQQQSSVIRSARTVANNIYPNYSENKYRRDIILKEINSLEGQVTTYQQANPLMPQSLIEKPYNDLKNVLSDSSMKLVHEMISDFSSHYVVGRSEVDAEGNFKMASGANMMALNIFNPQKKNIPSYLTGLASAIYSRDNKDLILNYSIAFYDLQKYEGDDKVLIVKNLQPVRTLDGRADYTIAKELGLTNQSFYEMVTIMRLSN